MNPSPLNNSESLINSTEKLDNQEILSESFDTYTDFTQATLMDEYNNKIYNEQLSRVMANRNQVEKDAKERVAAYNRLAKNLKEKEIADTEKRNNDGWAFFKDDEYWNYYFENINKSGYSESDNYLDNLKEDRYFPIKISKEYQQIGNFEESPINKASYKSNYEIYQGPKREYIYDVGQNKIYPDKPNFIPTEEDKLKNLKLHGLSEEDPQKDYNLLINAKINSIDKKIQAEQSKTDEQSKTTKDKFENVDKRLAEIYMKTLPPNEYKYDGSIDYTKPNESIKTNSFIYYIYCLILVIILYILFRKPS
jgi:hypothetical protein